MFENLSAFVATVLAVSLSTERLVAVVKTAFPVWMAAEKKTNSSEVDLVGDRWRRLRVQLVAFVSAWVASAAVAELHFFGSITIGTGPMRIPVIVLALLSMGGSAFWSSVVNYASAAKDIQQQTRATSGLAFQAEARRQGKTPLDSGMAAVARGGAEVAPGLASTLKTITSLSQPAFAAAESRLATNG